MSNVAIIDLGTNTFNLLIVKIDPEKSYKTLFQSKISVKLGEGGINNAVIIESAFKRGINALKEHLISITKYEAHTVIAYATSAIREACNGVAFITKAKLETGIDVKIISGDKEAELIYYGVRQAVKMSREQSLIIDIGGGSTEFSIGNKDGILWKQSFLLGAARLLEMFTPSDPITIKEIKTITNFLEQELEPLFIALKEYPVIELIGSSGSFDSLAEMIANKFYTPQILENITEYTYNLPDCAAIYGILIKSTKKERTEMKGLVSMRVDMMVVSSILVHFILIRCDIHKMRLSTFSLKEGMLFELMNK
ncbi:MAG: phosphatase [Bacteroidia bacterium]